MLSFNDSEKFEFNDTSFSLLMQQRVHRILLICSNYDAFMLEEDGRIDEQIFNEYVSLNLSNPPVFVQASSAKQAFEILENDKIDLVIEMLSIEGLDTFELAKQLKKKYEKIPIVVLTHFSREVSLRLKNEDLSAIDHVFCWLGNSNLLLAIVKLIEDRMNAPFDVEQVGVQTILLVEDSIRYTSSYLPELYKIVMKQAREFAREAANEHQKMLRMRGRPKVMLATNYEEAIVCYERYKNNLLGIISDVSFMRNGSKDPIAGISLCCKVKQDDPHLPFILQSSNKDFGRVAREQNAGFIHKYSKRLSIELREYILQNFGFGDFVFIDPQTSREVARASDLPHLQSLVKSVPDDSFEYHTRRNHLSKWLNARALFSIGRLFKIVHADDFYSLTDSRDYIYEAITAYLTSKGRGIIAQFDRENYNPYLSFCRVGEGSIGGKARGLAFINTLIKKYNLYDKYENVHISIPRSLVLGTDIFDEFIERNNLLSIGLSDASDTEITRAFVKATLTSETEADLRAFIGQSGKPLAIRSSSKLEDSYFQPFAGVYSTYMLPIDPADADGNVKRLGDAIKCVYASTFYTAGKAYMTATSNVIDEEKMGIIIQEVCGNSYGDLYYPAISGVARSINYYPIEPGKPADGVANIAMGLGRYIVSGGVSLSFSPKHPRRVIQLSSPEMALKQTQKEFYALNLNSSAFQPTPDDCVNLVKLDINQAEGHKPLRMVSSIYDFQNQVIRDGYDPQGRKLITFSNILNHRAFPLASILSELLEVGQREMNKPIEIEFAVNLDPPEGEVPVFNFLQIRPIVETDLKEVGNLDEIPLSETLIYSNNAMGNGIIDNIYDLVYVNPETFNPANSRRIASVLEKLNEGFLRCERNYILVGPGRWGSRDSWLGIPINWAQISQARLIVEAGMQDYRIDSSQGTHFFQNLTSFRVAYFTLNAAINDGYYDLPFLAKQTVVFEDNYLRHIRFDKPLKIIVDGRKNRGVVLKPQA